MHPGGLYASWWWLLHPQITLFIAIFANTFQPNLRISLGRNSREASNNPKPWTGPAGPKTCEEFGHLFFHQIRIFQRFFQTAEILVLQKKVPTWNFQPLLEKFPSTGGSPKPSNPPIALKKMVRIPRVFQEFASEAYRKKIQSEPPMPAHQARMDPPRGVLGGEWQGPIQTSTGMVRLKPTNLPWKSTIHVGCVGTIDGWYGITTWCCRFFFHFPFSPLYSWVEGSWHEPTLPLPIRYWTSLVAWAVMGLFYWKEIPFHRRCRISPPTKPLNHQWKYSFLLEEYTVYDKKADEKPQQLCQ